MPAGEKVGRERSWLERRQAENEADRQDSGWQLKRQIGEESST